MKKTLLECVPNISEGRDPLALHALYQTLSQLPELQILDYSADPDHHRSVWTWAAPPDVIEQALNMLFHWAERQIDLSRHQGAHPRIGAVDVIPLIPLQGISQNEAVQFSQALAGRLAQRFQLPIFLYEQSASQPERQNLAAIRRGQFEGLSEKLKQPSWAPDFGPAQPHPSLGATALGVRDFLIAFNLFYGKQELSAVKALAHRLRASSGGLPAVKALGLWLPQRQCAQLSFNLTDFRITSLQRLIQAVFKEGAKLGIEPESGEIIGLIPADAAWPGFEADLKLMDPRDVILEYHLRSV
ncbi:MAG: glutamate formimidoyltransferase [Candidatus Sericytochromatia bacterium]